MILVDANVLIDINDRSSLHRRWSIEAASRLAAYDILVTNYVAFAEFSVRIATPAEALAALRTAEIAILGLDDATAYRAGQAFAAYRRAGGPRTSLIPDFLIGAHAATLGATLLTRDGRRFARYFPELTMITPETHP